MKLKIAILGTRGIPNYYGGYEQAASYLAPGLVEKGHEVTVYNSFNHPYRQKEWNGTRIIHQKDPEAKIGAAGQFIYDWNCLRHAQKENYDVILMMGYTSSSVWGKFYPKKTIIISNMDGLEWKRSKYSKPVQQFLHYAERLAIKYSDHYIADSTAIQEYLRNKYMVEPAYIPYGAVIHDSADPDLLRSYRTAAHEYFLLVARLEPENNIEIILEGFYRSNSSLSFIVVGDTSKNDFGRKMKKRYGSNDRIFFAGAVFDAQILHTLRHFCRLYFHGHSVGGTNPSLLEAMASCAPIAAHDNPFNRAVTGDDAFYFSTIEDVANLVCNTAANTQMVANNLQKIKEQFNWHSVINQYEQFIMECCSKKKK